MRIGIFSDAYKPLISGVVTSIETLKEGLEQLGHEVYVITPYGPNQKEELDPHVIRLKGIRIPKKGLKDFRWVLFAKRYLKLVKKLELDVIHIHTEFSVGQLGLSAMKKFNIPAVYTLHTSYQDYTHYVSKVMTYFTPMIAKRIAGMINNKYTKRVDMTIVPTKKIYDRMIKLKHDGRFTIIPSGIELKSFYKESYSDEEVQALKDKLRIKKDDFVAIIVARIAKEKSIEDLVDGFVEFHQSYPKSVFFIVGDGPDRDKLENHIRKLKGNDFIKTLGFVSHDQVGLYYQIADVFLNASTTETQGLTYVEALAASLPIVVRYDDVFDSFVKHGENGIFFKQTSELVQILKDIQEQKIDLNILKENARKSVEPYSKEQYAKNLVKLYTQVIEERNEKKKPK